MAGCGGGSSSGTSGGTSAASVLTAGTGTGWVLDYHPVYNTVSFALPRGGAVALPAGSSQTAVLAFLDTYKDVLGMRDPENEFLYARTTTDDLGDENLHFVQQVGGVTVYGGDWVASVNASGQLESMGGTYVPNLATLDLTAVLTSDQAAALAATAAATDSNVPPASVQTAASATPFVYVDNQTAAALVFQVSADVDDVRTEYLVDARTGAIVTSLPGNVAGIMTYPYGPATTGYGYGAAHYRGGSAGMVAFPTTTGIVGYFTDTYYLQGTSVSGVSISTASVTAPSTIISGTPQVSFVDSSMPQGAAVDGQSTFAQVVDGYNKAFGRRSFDDANGPISVRINSNGSGAVNAFWRGGQAGFVDRLFGMTCVGTFGIGDGNASYLPMGAAFDIIAHEYTHAVSQCSWGGGTSGQTGSVNEGMSDVLGLLITGTVQGGHPVAIGGDITLKGNAPIRDVADPHDPTTFEKGPHCATVAELATCNGAESHHGSTIVSYAWYLMTFGGTNVATNKSAPCPLGWEKSSRLWYQVEAHELHQNPTYKDVANATIAAGKKQKLNLVGIACAWASVGVLGDADLTSLKIDCNTGDYSGDGGAMTDGGGSSLVHSAGPLLQCSGATLLE